MPCMSDSNRDLWLWLMRDGGAWTAKDVAAHHDRDSDEVFDALSNMARRGTVEVHQPLPGPGHRRLRYAVTGTCQVPLGLCVAEVQA